MYKIIGADQKEYGPVSSDQIQQWITSGRVNAQTRAQLDGGEWKKLGDFPEFAALLDSGGGVPPMVAPPLPSARPTKTSGLAIASLVLGVLGFFCGCTAIVGLILGFLAMSRIRKSNGTLGGHGLALAGTIVSGVALLIMVLLAPAMLLPALAKAKERALSIQCVNNLKQLSLAARIYANSHGDHFPAANNWCDALKDDLGNNLKVYKCPADQTNENSDYAYNAQVAGLDVKNVNPQTVLFFESQPGWNLSGGSEMLLSQPRHRTISVAFADGHVEQVSVSRLAELRWEP